MTKSHTRHENTRFSHNKWGFRGVIFRNDRKTFRAVVGRGSEEWRSRSCNTIEEAARLYDEKAREIYGKGAYLNFPGLGELQAEQRPPLDEVFECARGHNLHEHGAFNKKTGRTRCRICNAEARKRYYQRNKEST